MKKFNFGLAFHSKQGGKMLLNREKDFWYLERNKKMACIMETSVLQTGPELTRLVPQPKKKREKSDHIVLHDSICKYVNTAVRILDKYYQQDSSKIVVRKQTFPLVYS